MLPLGTDPEMFCPGEGDEELDGRIIYVGSPGFGNEEKYFSGLDKNHVAIELCKYFEGKLFSGFEPAEQRSNGVITPSISFITLRTSVLTWCTADFVSHIIQKFAPIMPCE